MTPKEWLSQHPNKGMNDYYNWLAENPKPNKQKTITTINHQPVQIIINQPAARKQDNNIMIMLVGAISLVAYFLPWLHVGFLGVGIGTISLSNGFYLLDLFEFQGDTFNFRVLFYGVPVSSFLIFIGGAIRNMWLVVLGQSVYVFFVLFFCFLAYMVMLTYPEVRFFSSLTYGAYLAFGCVLFFIFDMVRDFL